MRAAAVVWRGVRLAEATVMATVRARVGATILTLGAACVAACSVGGDDTIQKAPETTPICTADVTITGTFTWAPSTPSTVDPCTPSGASPTTCATGSDCTDPALAYCVIGDGSATGTCEVCPETPGFVTCDASQIGSGYPDGRCQITAPDPARGCQPGGTWTLTVAIGSGCTPSSGSVPTSFTYAVTQSVGDASVTNTSAVGSDEHDILKITDDGNGCTGAFDQVIPVGGQFAELQLSPAIPPQTSATPVTTYTISGTGTLDLWATEP